MAYETKAGQGSIFRNGNKKAENHPDYTGKIKTPDGKEWDISMWVKEGQKGKFFSASIKEPYQKQQSTHPVMQGPATPLDNDANDLPF